MTVRQITFLPPCDLSHALERFERQFTYPLGPHRSFRISHGEDYACFYRAIGEAACFVAEREGTITGAICAALRALRLPDGSERTAVYLGDLKVDPAERRTRALLHLAAAVARWLNGRAKAAYSVVMDGTSALPTTYTGRLGLPLFQELGRISVLRLPTNGATAVPAAEWIADGTGGNACFQRLLSECYAGLGGYPGERSMVEPIWLVDPAERACGRLEDTRRAKRLFADDGREMLSAHLSCFSYLDLRAGMALLHQARARAAKMGYPALFVAVPDVQTSSICEALAGTDVVVAPATVFGAGLPAGRWNINTAEI